jgi:uncharacterized protein
VRDRDDYFFSDDLQLAASWYEPDEVADEDRLPLTIICSGFTGLRTFHPTRFAKKLTQRGLRCFSFDYRGVNGSSGALGKTVLDEQVRDVRNAVAFAMHQSSVDETRIALAGWGMGAGVVLDAARIYPQLSGIAALNGFYDGARFQLAHRGDNGLADLRADAERDRRSRACDKSGKWVDPFDIYPLDRESGDYVDEQLRPEAGFQGERYSYDLADSLLAWKPEAYAPYMEHPLFIAHGRKNELHPPEEAQSLHDLYAGEDKELVWLDDADHTSWMRDDHPTFQLLCDRLGDWLSARFERS